MLTQINFINLYGIVRIKEYLLTVIPLAVVGFSHAYSLLRHWFLVPPCLINILHYLH